MNESNMSALEWARERWANTVRLAATKTGNDREGWLEDGRYWLAIVETLEAHDRLHTSLTRQSEGLARLIAQGRALRPHWTTSEDGFHTVDPVPAGEEQWGRWLKKSEVYTLLDKLTALVSPEVPTS